MASLLQAVRGLVGKAGGNGADDGQQTPDQDADQSKALETTKQTWEDLKNAYVVYHQSVWQTLLFYANQSWIDWDDARKVWQPQQPNDEWVPRPRINRFSPTVDAVCSNFFKLPEIECQPKPDDDPIAMQVSNIASLLTDHFLVSNGFKGPIGAKMDKAGLAAQLFVLCGGVFTILSPKKVQKPVQARGPEQDGWSVTCDMCKTVNQTPNDPGSGGTCEKCGQPLRTEATKLPGELQSNPDGSPVTNETDVYEDICCATGNTLYAFPRPGSTDIDTSPYLLWAERQPLDTIYFRYDEFEASPDSIWPDGYSITYEHALNFWYTGYSSSTIQTKDSCMTLSMYVAPDKMKDHPDGFYLVSINDKCAHFEEWQFPEHPITLGHYLTLPTIFFPRSVAFDLAEIQRELNAYESLIKLHAMTSSVDPIMVEANTLVNEITGRCDKIIKWRRVNPNSGPPARLASGHLDDGVYKQRDNLHAEFQNISMAVNAFRGEQEGAIVAASAIQQLRGQAEQMFSKPQENWASLWRETCRKAVKFYQKYVPMAEIQKICSAQDSIADVRAFMQADLDSSLEWFSSQHGMPRTRDERKQELATLWDKGALDINNPDVKQKIYELYGETGMMKGFNRDATRARLENVAFKSGKGQNIRPMVGIEDLGVHFYIHTDKIKSIDFDSWPPEAKQQLIEHALETKKALDAMQQQQMQMAAAQEKATKTTAEIQGKQGQLASQAKGPEKNAPGKMPPPK